MDSTVFALCVDLTGDYNPIDMMFKTLRQDIVIFNRKSVFILELTIAHETNLEAAESRKDSKYANLSTNLKDRFSQCTLYKHFLQVSNLGFISDTTDFCNKCKLDHMPSALKMKLLACV